MKKADVVALVDKWQPILGLRDWAIEVEVVPHYEMPDRVGECTTHLEVKFARIRVVDPKHLDPKFSSVERDLTHTVLHELIEIGVATFYDGEAVAKEQFVNAMATALILADGD